MGSRKKTTASTSPTARRAPICRSPPRGPECRHSTCRPTSSRSRAPVVPVAAPAALVDQASQCLKDLRRAMNFVKDHQAILVGTQEQGWIGELGAVFGGFQVEIDRRPLVCDIQSERRLSDLPWSDNGHGRLPCQRFPDLCFGTTLYNHPCISKLIF